MTVTWLLHSALTWVESSKLSEEREERGRCWHEEEEEEEEEEEVDNLQDQNENQLKKSEEEEGGEGGMAVLPVAGQI